VGAVTRTEQPSDPPGTGEFGRAEFVRRLTEQGWDRNSAAIIAVEYIRESPAWRSAEAVASGRFSDEDVARVATDYWLPPPIPPAGVDPQEYAANRARIEAESWTASFADPADADLIDDLLAELGDEDLDDDHGGGYVDDLGHDDLGEPGQGTASTPATGSPGAGDRGRADGASGAADGPSDAELDDWAGRVERARAEGRPVWEPAGVVRWVRDEVPDPDGRYWHLRDLTAPRPEDRADGVEVPDWMRQLAPGLRAGDTYALRDTEGELDDQTAITYPPTGVDGFDDGSDDAFDAGDGFGDAVQAGDGGSGGGRQR
jgi:hypothetical protein